MDADSGAVLAEMNANAAMEPASITKMMTAYAVDMALLEGDIKSSDMVTVSEQAWRTEGSRMFIEVGKQVSVADLLKGLVIQSGNDAAVALAEHVAGGEQSFSALMNHHAERLGLDNSHFVNATGLPDPEHVMSARDIAELSRAIIRDFPEEYKLYAVKEFTFSDIKQYNRNQLLWRDESVDGLKTGHTQSAGYCLAASAKRGDQRLISVVLGSPSEKARTSASQALLGYGFRFYITSELYAGGEALASTRVWKGEQSEVDIGLEQTLYVTVPRGRHKDLEAAMIIDSEIEAPITTGERVGTVRVSLGDETLSELPLVALNDVGEAGFVGRMSDATLKWFNSFFE
jgi:D-alanyl-D-alanine carboxypeptidase (penicillin-binding protein 5/6)